MHPAAAIVMQAKAIKLVQLLIASDKEYILSSVVVGVPSLWGACVLK
jgi:hypothetical protein